MSISIFTEVRVYFCENEFYCDASFNKVIERYLENFKQLNLFTRVINVEEKPNGLSPLNKNDIKFYNVGSLQKFICSPLKQNFVEVIKKSNLIVLRLPSLVSLKIFPIIKKYKKKYLCEVMGCAFDAYWNHGIIGKIIAIPMYFYTRKMIKNSDYCIYVTEKFLQHRYPTNGYSTNASNVNIKPSKIIKKYNEQEMNKTHIKLFTAAAVNVKYKGQEYVIKAMKKLKDENIIIDYYLAGKGDNIYLKKVSQKYKVADRVHFLGMLTHEELYEKMRDSDIYVQPSLQEGLPRSVIEAMNNGMVCLGSNTAGIPELLDDNCVFKRKSTKAFYKCLKEILKEDFNKISERNLKEAKKYYSEILDERRKQFYEYIKKEVKVGNGN